MGTNKIDLMIKIAANLFISGSGNLDASGIIAGCLISLILKIRGISQIKFSRCGRVPGLGGSLGGTGNVGFGFSGSFSSSFFLASSFLSFGGGGA